MDVWVLSHAPVLRATHVPFVSNGFRLRSRTVKLTMMGDLDGDRCEMKKRWVMRRVVKAAGNESLDRSQRPRFWSWGCRGALTLISLQTTLARGHVLV